MWLEYFEKWLFPPVCVLSGEPSVRFDLGEEALLALQPVERGCRCCGVPLPNTAKPNSYCGLCQQTPPFFDETVVGFEYNKVMRDLILRYKFNPEPHLSRLLFELFYSIRQEALLLQGVEAIVPVPSHSSRLMERGFNPALALAKPLAKMLRVPLLPFAVDRVRDTPPQSSLPLRERQQNLKGAFYVKPEAFQGVHTVLLVDDVMTTGHTLSVLAEAIKTESGVQRVVNAVVARRIKEG